MNTPSQEDVMPAPFPKHALFSTQSLLSTVRTNRNWLLAVFLLVGSTIRIINYVANRSVWNDEAWLGNDILDLSWQQLFGPPAPVGFLFVEKLSTVLFGHTEFALRLVPLVCSILTLFLVAGICRRLDRTTAWVGVGLAAFAPGLIYYAIEIKQYSMDSAIALWIIYQGLIAWERGMTPYRCLSWAVQGTAFVWLSHSSVFVLAAVGSCLIVANIQKKQHKAALLTILAAAVWGVSFVGEYLIQIRTLGQDPALKSFWEPGQMKIPPASLKDISRDIHILIGFFAVPFEDYSESSIAREMAILSGVLWLMGVAYLASKSSRMPLALLVAPLGFTIFASSLGQYPLIGRMVLFLSGPILVVMAAGITSALDPAAGPGRGVGWIVLAGALFLPVHHTLYEGLKGEHTSGARKVFGKVARDFREGDVLVLHWTVEGAFRFYKSAGGIEGFDRLVPSPVKISDKNAMHVAREGGPLKSHERVWFVIECHPLVASAVPVEQIVHDLDVSAHRLDQIRSGNYRAILYDCR